MSAFGVVMEIKFKKGYLHQYAAYIVLIIILMDVLIISAMHFFSLYANQIPVNKNSLLTLTIVLLVFLFTAYETFFYHSHRTSSIAREIGQLLIIWLISIGILAAVLFSFERLSPEDPSVLKAWFVITPFLLILVRVVIRGVTHKLRKMGRNFRNVAIIGATEMGVRIHSSIFSNTWMGLKFEGFYDQRNMQRLADDPSFGNMQSGYINNLIERIESDEIHIVYIALPMCAQKRIKNLIERLAHYNVGIYYAPDFYSLGLLHSRWDNIDGQPVISIVETPFLGNTNIAKRLQDLVITTPILSVLAIPLTIVAILIKLDSAGPVFYRQKRYGLDGKAFMIWKFRTMKDRPNAQHFVQATQNDSRVTRLGSFLRKYSIDELPQLINVLIGQMSIVGPRPHPIALDEEHLSKITRYNLRFKVKPGITGWAQVNGFRGETDTLDKMEARIQYDLEYISNWSFLFDIKILLMTIACVVKPVNAH